MHALACLNWKASKQGMILFQNVTFLVIFLILRSTESLSNPLPSHLKQKIASSITKGERRHKERQSVAREVCSGCSRPIVLCLCDSIPAEKLVTNTTILVLQHPNEFRKKTFSTVPLLSLVLENVHVKVGYEFDVKNIPLVQEFLENGRRPLLLFPGEDAVSLDEAFIDDNRDFIDAPHKHLGHSLQENLLIVIDGTWAEAKRMALKSPSLLQACQHVEFSGPRSSLYDSIRKEPDKHCLSTLEACAEALQLIEGATKASEALMHVLRSMVESRLEMDQMRDDEPRQKRDPAQLQQKQQRRRQVQEALFFESRPKILEDGIILRQLTVEDAPVINRHWYHPSEASLQMIKRFINRGSACLGIEVNGHLRAHILRGKDKSLCLLHVEETYRMRGFGRVLVEEASDILDRLGEPKIAYIKSGDSCAETFFASLGWKIAPGFESRVGRRKWFFSEEVS